MATVRTNTDGIVVHCSATDPDWHGRITVDDIERWHIERGFDQIGYHLYIDRDGVLHEGRPLHLVGAHVQGHNNSTVGICLEGGVEVERNAHTGAVTFRSVPNYTHQQFTTLGSVIYILRQLYPLADVKGHRDYVGVIKQCPSFDVQLWWDEGVVEP